jgi:outer membrane protein OmpA-like peptidoglycan-associated protein
MKPGANYMHPALSADGKQLYFSSNNEDSWGGYDIFVSNRGADGAWEPPTPLSRNINTPNDEQFPWLDQDTLYFASDGHPGMGGLDVFRTQRASNGAWLTPRNLQAPINSGADDFAFFLDKNAQPEGDVLAMGYVSSRRVGGEGADDVYVLEKIKLPPLPPKPPVEIVYKNWLEVYVLEKIYRQPGDPNSEVIGRKPLPGATLEIILGRDARKVTVDENGMFKLELKDNSDYNFLASAEGLLTGQSSFSAKGIGRDPERPEQVFELEIVLERIFVDKEIRLENIYYDFDQWFIRDDAKPTLDELARLLKINPAVRIQLGSHTDCRGADAYNEQLSQRRAQSAVDYLIAQGIDPVRLEARGYGESAPANECLCARCTEDEHQYNRRTTFKIVE